MRTSRLIMALLVLLLAVDIAAAATLHGNIYDIELNELNNVIVEVDSEPNQRFVSKDGAYSFDLTPGNYTITANYTQNGLWELTVEESVSITKDGDYVFDLFLFPELDLEEEELMTGPDLVDVSDTGLDEVELDWRVTVALIAIASVVFLLMLYFMVGHLKRREETEELEEAERLEEQRRDTLKEELEDARVNDGKQQAAHKKNDDLEEDLHKLVSILRREGGRITQKELRKEFPLSEAKISLMISELEHKNIVKKVKKGRGNIIILKKK